MSSLGGHLVTLHLTHWVKDRNTVRHVEEPQVIILGRCYNLSKICQSDVNNRISVTRVNFICFCHLGQIEFANLLTNGEVNTLTSWFNFKLTLQLWVQLVATLNLFALHVVTEQLSLPIQHLDHNDLGLHYEKVHDSLLSNLGKMFQTYFLFFIILEYVHSVNACHSQQLHIFFESKGNNFVLFDFLRYLKVLYLLQIVGLHSLISYINFLDLKVLVYKHHFVSEEIEVYEF